MSEQILGIISGVFTSTSLVPQVFKVFREKKAGDLSYWMIIIMIAGLSGWIVYGVMKDEMPIILTNCFAVFVNVFLLIGAIKYKNSN